jgi:DnaJ-class molecular chaperone
MDSFTDYYAVLGVDSHASASTIKAAFKKLALKYHPDVYKGPDAQERMRDLLLAYQTLSDPGSRRNYDVQRAEHLLDIPDIMQDEWQRARVAGEPRFSSINTSKPSRGTRGEDQRAYAFPDLNASPLSQIKFNLGDVSYQLWPDDIFTLKNEGILRGIANQSNGGLANTSAQHPENYCHRCHHRWIPGVAQSRSPSASFRVVCPSCKASDWAEYVLLRCVHCHAIFESEEIRDKILGGGQLYNPYELFPLCPHCRRSQWCPAENIRIDALRAATARRRAILWMSVFAIALLVIGIMAVMLVRLGS